MRMGMEMKLEWKLDVDHPQRAGCSLSLDSCRPEGGQKFDCFLRMSLLDDPVTF